MNDVLTVIVIDGKPAVSSGGSTIAVLPPSHYVMDFGHVVFRFDTEETAVRCLQEILNRWVSK